MRRFGEFRSSGYRDVVVGYVTDVHGFLETMENIRRENPEKLRSLGQIVPVEKNFQFEVSDFMDRAKEAVSPYVNQLENSRFFVRVVRRGHKGEISSLEAEKELDAFILKSLGRDEKQATVCIEEFEKMIVVQTVGNLAGVGLITRDMKEEYPLIKIK